MRMCAEWQVGLLFLHPLTHFHVSFVKKSTQETVVYCPQTFLLICLYGNWCTFIINTWALLLFLVLFCFSTWALLIGKNHVVTGKVTCGTLLEPFQSNHWGKRSEWDLGQREGKSPDNRPFSLFEFSVEATFNQFNQLTSTKCLELALILVSHYSPNLYGVWLLKL